MIWPPPTATLEGIFRNHMLLPITGIRHSAYYSITVEEWPEVRAGLQVRIAHGREVARA